MRVVSLLAFMLVVGMWQTHLYGQEPIIDMHLHAFAYDEYGFPPPPNEVTGKTPGFESDEAAMGGVFEAMSKAGIVRAVASGPFQIAERWRLAAPDKIMVGAYAGPRDQLPPLGTIRRLAREGKLSVLGELGLQYRGLEPNSKKLRKYWKLAEELDLPVAIHTGLGDSGTPYGCCPKFRARLGNPLLLEDVLVDFPKMRVYLMHAGYPFLQETLSLLIIYPQVYVDLAVINWAIPRNEFHRYLQALITAGLGDRLMFGSDQMVWPDAIEMAVAGIESANFLSQEQKRAIFYGNAARFLKLTPEQIKRDHAAVGR